MKLISLVLIVAAIVGIYYLGRASRQWSRTGEVQGKPDGGRGGAPKGDVQHTDLIACDKCGTYRSLLDTRIRCDRADCPLLRPAGPS